MAWGFMARTPSYYRSYPGVVRQALIRQARAPQAGYFYYDPAFVEAERRLRERVGGQMTALQASLARQGYSPEDIARLSAPAQMQAARAFQSLYSTQAGIEQQRAEERAERRRQRRARLLGFLATAPFNIASLVLQGQGLAERKAFHEGLLEQMMAQRQAEAQQRQAETKPTSSLQPIDPYLFV